MIGWASQKILFGKLSILNLIHDTNSALSTLVNNILKKMEGQLWTHDRSEGKEKNKQSENILHVDLSPYCSFSKKTMLNGRVEMLSK